MFTKTALLTKLSMDDWLKHYIKTNKEFRDIYRKMSQGENQPYVKIVEAARAHGAKNGKNFGAATGGTGSSTGFGGWGASAGPRPGPTAGYTRYSGASGPAGGFGSNAHFDFDEALKRARAEFNRRQSENFARATENLKQAYKYADNMNAGRLKLRNRLGLGIGALMAVGVGLDAYKAYKRRPKTYKKVTLRGSRHA